MNENSLLERLFPDTSVRNLVRKVNADKEKHSEVMSTDYSFLDKKKDVIFTSSGQPCFGSLWINWKANPEARYLSYLPKYSSKVTRKNRLRWIELGHELGILPSEVDVNYLHTNGLLIDIDDPELTMSGLYLKLTYMRWMREAASVVNNTILLVDGAGRDFWAAAMFSHMHGVSRLDHSLLPFSSGYPATGHHKAIDRDLALVMKMHEVTVAPQLADKRVVKTTVAGNAYKWNWQSQTVKPKSQMVLTNRLMLLSSELHPLIYSGSPKKAAEMIKTLKQRGSHVEFE